MRDAAVFDSVEFDGIIALGPMGGTLIQFVRAIFRSNASFELTADWIIFNHARFEEGATIHVGVARIQAENVTFSRTTAILPPSAPLSIDRTNPDVVELDRSTPNPQAQLISLRGTDTFNLTLSGIDLSDCLFATTAHLDQLGLDGTVTFASTPRDGYLRWLRSRRQMIIEEHHWRSQHLKYSSWCKSVNHPMSSASAVVIQEPEVIAVIYRSLRKSQEDSKNEPGAADFYYGEMEMRRHSKNRNAAEWLIIVTYWLFSGYGLRAIRAMAALLASVLIVALLMQRFGYRDNFHPAFRDSLLSDGQAILSLSLNFGRISQITLTRWGELLRILIRIFGPVFIALALLSIRNRIKR